MPTLPAHQFAMGGDFLVYDAKVTTVYRDRLFANYGHDFQDVGESFDHRSARQWGRARTYHLRGWLPEDRNAGILDVACGSGKLLHFFSRHRYVNLAGIDISRDQVALARQVTPDVAQGNVLEYLEQKPESYDLITGYDIVEHFRKDEVLRFLDGCHSALRPGGRLVLQTPNADSPWGMGYIYGDFTHEVGFNPNALSRLLRLAGFCRIEAREAGPVPWGNSAKSTLRYFIWQIIRVGLLSWNLAETGTKGSGILTRVFLISAVKGGEERLLAKRI